MKKDKKKPFFARYLETQQLEEVTGGKPPFQTLKYPSDKEEGGYEVTMKYPSDDDEAGEPI